MILVMRTRPRHPSLSRPATATGAVTALALALAACAGADSADDGGSPPGADTSESRTADPSEPPSGEPDSEDHDHTGDHHEATAAADPRETVESAGPSPRLGVTYDGGVLVVDALTLEVVGDFPAQGFTRLNPAGDDRHLLLTEGSAFRVLDAGAWSEPHGSHDHSYVTDPALTDVSFPADHPGHVVTHDSLTVLFADGSGEITVFDPEDLAEGGLPQVERTATSDAHHGVALRLSDASILHTVGDEESRSGAVVVAEDGTEVARSEECPGVHGETVAADETVVLGCEDGVLTYRDEQFTKVEADEDYARIGNVAGSERSPVVLGDYKTDPDAELERPTAVSLVDTQAAHISLVDLPASYSFRSLGRGPEGEALVLGTDGALRSIDPESGDISGQTPVVAAWEEPEDWQQPRPTLFRDGRPRLCHRASHPRDPCRRPPHRRGHRLRRAPPRTQRGQRSHRLSCRLRRRPVTGGSQHGPSPGC